jgi:hypothetical protein
MAQYTQEEMDRMLAQARAEFLNIPGVRGVGFGYREKAGRLTEELAWKVYVTEKKPKEALPESQVIPAKFLGFHTDVVKVKEGKSSAPCEDSNSYSPLVGGATISNLLTNNLNQIAVGTLGFFATINGNSNAKENVVFVTNNHVVAENGGAANTAMYQPYRVNNAGVSTPTNDQNHPHDVVGSVANFGGKLMHPYTYPSTAQINYYVDAATVKLDLSISSWCDTHCGTKFKPEVRLLAINASSKIAGFERVANADITALPVGTFYDVVKFGHKTSRTQGKITECNALVNVDGVDVDNVIVIVSTVANCDGQMIFSKKGDSGAAIINNNRKVVGLLFGGSNDQTQTWACHIHPVIDYLGVTPITEAATHTYMSTLSDSEATLIGGTLFKLKMDFKATPNGEAIYALIEEHRWEVTTLVNTCRPVTVAWHRHQGPAFLNRLMANSRNPEIPIPDQIEGVTLRQLAEAMLPVLQENGSPALAAALQEWSATALPLTDGLKSLHVLVSQLSPATPL